MLCTGKEESQLLVSAQYFYPLPVIRTKLVVELQKSPSGVGLGCGSMIRHICDESGFVDEDETSLGVKYPYAQCGFYQHAR